MDESFKSAQSLFNQKEFNKSAILLGQILEKDQNSINALILMARCMLSTDHIDSAIQSVERILKIEPKTNEASVIFLEILESCKKSAYAEKYCKKILSIKSDCIEAIIMLADIEYKKSDIENSITLLKKATQIDRDNHTVLYQLAQYLMETGKAREALNFSARLLNLKSDSAKYHKQCGRIHYNLKDMYNASESFKNALAIDVNDFDAKLWLNRAYSTVPAWHIPMMNDLKRNNAYLKAIIKAIEDDAVVLEIGTGSGLLSMMAIDAGAKSVITCEADKIIAKTAEKIISKNGYAEKIQVLGKKSTELIVGSDVPHKVDIVLSEILSSEFVGEGVIPTMIDANKRLIKDNGKMIPESGEILVTLITESANAKKDNIIENQFGYNLSDFNNALQTKKSNILKETPSYTCSIEAPFSFNFYDTKTLIEKEKIFELEVLTDSVYYGIITWLKLNLYEDIVFENKPSSLGSGWVNPIYYFKEPLHAQAGQKIRLKGSLMQDSVWFEFLGIF